MTKQETWKSNLDRKKRLGYAGYAKFMACMPGTSEQLAGKMGLCINTANLLAREMHKLGIIHRIEVAPGRPRCGGVSVWAAGAGESVPHRADKSRFTPRPMMIAFASLVKALQEPMTVAELKEETGIQLTQIRQSIKVLRRGGLCHIGGWERRHGAPVVAWKWGKKPDKCKPRPMTRAEANARYRERTKELHQTLVRMKSAVSSVWKFAEVV